MGIRYELNFTKEDILMTNKHIKKCWIPPVIREMYINTRYTIHTPEWVILKILTTLVGEEVEQLQFSYITGGSIKWNSGEKCGSLSQNWTYTYLNPATLSLGIYPRRKIYIYICTCIFMYFHKITCLRMVIAALFIIDKN